MTKILFVTSNKRKVWQATDRLEKFGIEIESADLDVPEIQAHDPLDIAIAKAEAAYAHFKRPLVVCDHSWAFHALKGFPGGYMKDMNAWLETEDWLALLKDKKDREVTLTEMVVYIDGDKSEHFVGEFPGKIINEPRGIGKHSSERVTVFDGYDVTIAEQADKGEHARDMANSAWEKFGEWYSNWFYKHRQIAGLK